jgi:hypothetical protein
MELTLTTRLVAGTHGPHDVTLAVPDLESRRAVLDATVGQAPCQQAIALLDRCIAHAGAQGGDDGTRALAVGDREAVLLQLRAALFGDDLEAVVRCPAPGCGTELQVALRVSELLPATPDRAPAPHELAWDDDEGSWHASFRLPTGADQLAALGLAEHDALTGLLRACVLSVTRDGAEPGYWPVTLSDRVEERMAELDPLADILLAANCPDCGTAWDIPFDAGSYLIEEMAADVRAAEAEVHLLALAYHWSEGDILALAPARRRRYLERVLQEPAPGGSMW